jgi:hypothetical protein
LRQRSIDAPDRVLGRQRNPFDGPFGGVVLFRFTAAQIWAGPVLGVRSHDQQITRLTLIAVRDAGRHYNDIACLNRQHCPVRAAEQHRRLTAGNTKDLVRRTMKVVKWMHAVAPCWRPAIGGEDPLDGGRVSGYRVRYTSSGRVEFGMEPSSSNVNASGSVM